MNPTTTGGQLKYSQARQPIVYHSLSGMGATRLPDGGLALPHVGCKSSASQFHSPQHMSHAVHSIILSACFTDVQLAVVARVLGSSLADGLSVLAARRAELLKNYNVSNPLHDVFDGFERLSKAALTSLASLHGVNISGCSLDAARQLVSTHVGSGECGLHGTSFRHLGCTSLLALSQHSNTNLHVSNMDLESPSSLDFDLAQIHILSSIMPKLSKRPLKRILQMHNVEFKPADGTVTLRRCFKQNLRRLRRGKKISGHGVSNLSHKQREQELESLRSDWPRLIPSSRRRMLVEALSSAISKDTLSSFVCASCSGKSFVKDKRTLGLDDFDINLRRPPRCIDTESSELGEMDIDPQEIGSNQVHSDDEMDVEKGRKPRRCRFPIMNATVSLQVL